MGVTTSFVHIMAPIRAQDESSAHSVVDVEAEDVVVTVVVVVAVAATGIVVSLLMLNQ